MDARQLRVMPYFGRVAIQQKKQSLLGCGGRRYFNDWNRWAFFFSSMDSENDNIEIKVREGSFQK